MTANPLCLFAADPDVREQGFLVQVLTGSPRELAERSLALGYDGFEFMPNPANVPDPEPFRKALNETGALLPVVNTGRMARQGLTLFHPDPQVEQAARRAFERMLDFAGALGAKVGLGICRGPARPDLTLEAMDRHAAQLFGELAEYAARAGTVIMLEQAETKATRYILTMNEVMQWAERIGSPAFGVMLDTAQMSETEPSIEQGIRAANRQAQHIHLFDRDRWPPGTRADGRDWESIFDVLQAEGFRGPASVALAPGDDPERAARRVSEFVRRHWKRHSSIRSN